MNKYSGSSEVEVQKSFENVEELSNEQLYHEKLDINKKNENSALKNKTFNNLDYQSILNVYFRYF